MSELRKKPGMAFWATVVVAVVLVGYPLSFGPACWLVERETLSKSRLAGIYEPCIRLCDSGPKYVKLGLWQWVEVCGGDSALAQIIVRRRIERGPYLLKFASFSTGSR